MTHRPRHHYFKPGMNYTELMVVIFVIIAVVTGFFFAAMLWKRKSDRQSAIMNIRNCQQCMRGEQGMRQLNPGDVFTRADIEKYMEFPRNFTTLDGGIEFIAGDKVTPDPPRMAGNGDHLWLKHNAPHTKDYVGRYGFKDIAESSGW